MRKCPTCQAAKPDTDFYPNGKGPCRECHRQRQKIWDASNRKKKLEYNRAWRKRNSGRRKIMLACTNAFWKAIRDGRLKRGKVCAFCDSTEAIEGAHTDYDKPLAVIWLCRKCHRIWDSIQPKTKSVG